MTRWGVVVGTCNAGLRSAEHAWRAQRHQFGGPGAPPNWRQYLMIQPQVLATACVVAPAYGFWLLDNDRVMVETFSAELSLAQPQEISLYSGIVDSLAAVASYGRAARALINRVIDDLANTWV